MEKNEIVLYQSKDGKTTVPIKLGKDNIWITQKDIAGLFKTERSVVTKHLNNIFKIKELEKNSVCAIFAHTAGDGKDYKINYYNLDAVISVGYRVNSKRATQFRQWATQILKNHIVNGFSVNKDRLQDLDRLYHYLSDTLSVTVMNLNKLRIDSARQKDLAVLAEDMEKIKEDLKSIKEKNK
jgi:hypothetical protein